MCYCYFGELNFLNLSTFSFNLFTKYSISSFVLASPKVVLNAPYANSGDKPIANNT